VYGSTGERGDTERIIGRWFALGDGRRDAVVLATKVFNTMQRDSVRPEPNSDGRNLSAYKIRKHSEASRRGLMGLVSEQSIYHLDNRTIELEVIPACRHYGLGLLPWSPLAGGLLGGVLRKIEGGRRMAESLLDKVEAKRPQLEQAVRATEVTLDEEVLERLDEIFPGPGGEAPKAHAW
jgi:aryl-alcohol dehydrogenase-like predicted oxidoreductase